jgi:uncharacterized membrane protein YidH (DUF202 family)
MCPQCALVKHLPVLIFGRAAGFNAAQRDVPSDSSLISSVYFDNPALDVYRERLERNEGATLIRVRAYGDIGGAGADEAELFVERKTHHESWTTDNSVKERCVTHASARAQPAALRCADACAHCRRSFRLKGKHVASLLRGELDLEAQLEKLRAGGATEADVARTRALAAEVDQELHARSLAPSLRTVYYRTAFQLATSNAVRVSLDTQLRMVDERGCAAAGINGWCRRLDAAAPLASHEVVEFPFAILEIKLQDQPPDWIADLLASGRLVQCTKFSKFLHGACAQHEAQGGGRRAAQHVRWRMSAYTCSPCCADTHLPCAGSAALRPTEVPKLPHWWDDAAVASTPVPDASAAASVAVTLASGARSIGQARAYSQCSIGIAENGSEDDLAALRQQPKRVGLLPRSMSAPTSVTLETVVTMSPVAAISVERQAASNSGPPKKGWLASLLGGSGGARERDGGSSGGSGAVPPSKSGALLTATAKRHVPIKIEPKTFFANERTMLQWLNMATLILFTSLALTTYNDPMTRGNTLPNGSLDYSSQIAGAVLAPVAVIFIVYARTCAPRAAVATPRAQR